jgi:hypothetical protein
MRSAEDVAVYPASGGKHPAAAYKKSRASVRARPAERSHRQPSRKPQGPPRGILRLPQDGASQLLRKQPDSPSRVLPATQKRRPAGRGVLKPGRKLSDGRPKEPSGRTSS